MVGETILSSFFAVRIVYPFLLVFTLIFAILQKSRILGEDKRQIDALVALSIALIFIAIPYPVDVVIGLMPFLAVSVVVLLVFMILYGFVSPGDDGFKLDPITRKALLGLIVLLVVFATLVATGVWNELYYGLFVDYAGSSVLTNIILLLIVAGAMAAVILTGKN